MSSADLLSTTPVPSIIGGKPVSGSSTYDVIRTDDPTGKEVLHKVASCGVDEAAQAIAAAKEAFKSWSKTSVAERRAVLQKAAELLMDEERVAEYNKITVQETVASNNFSMFQMANLALSHLEEAAASLNEALTASVAPPHPPFGEAKRAITVREPFGVVLGIAPWNAPMILGLRAVIYPIAAGNTVIMKTSEFSPQTHLLVYHLLRDAGLPEGVLNVLHIDPKAAPQVVDRIISDDAVGFVNFTGSTRVGKILAETCGRYLKPCIMELGGKAPMIVLPDADLDVCANHIIMAGYLHAGQICMSTNNIFVHADAADALTKKIHANFDKYKLKASASQDSHIRPLFAPSSAKRVSDLYDDAIAKGAKVAAGTPGFDGATVQPLLLSGVTPDMRILRNETFGPIVGLATYTDKQEAIDLVNSNPEAGLSASVYGKDETECWLVAKQLMTGAIHINSPSIHDHGAIPHGGVRLSGFGRFNGTEGIRAHTWLKTITIAPPVPLPLEHIL